MLLEKDQTVAETKTKEEKIQSLEAEIEDGRRAERLQVNQDFSWFKTMALAPVSAWDTQKLEYYDSILEQANTKEAEDAAVQHIKKMNNAVEAVRNIFKIVDVKQNRAVDVAKELTKLRGE